MGKLQPINNTRFVQIVGRHFHFYAVTGSQADEAFAHFARDVGEDLVLVSQFNPEHGAGQHRQNCSFQLDVFLHAFLKAKRWGTLFPESHTLKCLPLSNGWFLCDRVHRRRHNPRHRRNRLRPHWSAARALRADGPH